MTKYCKSCGKENEDNSLYCSECGGKFDDASNTDHNDFKDKLPLIFSILSMIIVIIECLSAPILIGVDSILITFLVSVIGGIIGIYLMKKGEYLISGLEFIAVAIIVYLFLGNLALIGTIFFIITGIIVLYIKGMNYSNKKLFIIPILTIVLVFVALIAGGAVYVVNSQNSIEVGNITNNIALSYGYYDGEIQGDINIGSEFDYVEVDVDYYDSDGKIIYSGIAWNELDPESGQTYHFSSYYFDQNQPATAKITVYDNANHENELYSENVTLS